MSMVSALLAGLSLLACNAAVVRNSNVQNITPVSAGPSQARSNEISLKVEPKNSKERIIWVGESSGIRIRWTTIDLYAQSASGMERLFAPLVRKGFEDYIALQTEGNQRAVPQGCEYERDFKILSVVGTLVSFEDSYYAFCGGAHPELDTRFTIVDLARSGDLQYAHGEDMPMMDADMKRLGKIVRLTDYFNEQDILNALLADPVVKKSLV